jgi:hypothetical protein
MLLQGPTPTTCVCPRETLCDMAASYHCSCILKQAAGFLLLQNSSGKQMQMHPAAPHLHLPWVCLAPHILQHHLCGAMHSIAAPNALHTSTKQHNTAQDAVSTACLQAGMSSYCLEPRHQALHLHCTLCQRQARPA